MKSITIRDQMTSRDKVQWAMKTAVGTMYLVASKSVLHGVYWKEQDVPYVEDLSASKILSNTVEQMQQYLAGRRQDFDLPLDAEGGTAFQRQVWNELKGIPYGETCSYSDIARNLKNDRAVRAVGTANGRNPFSIIVPCHRVIAANGTLAGYAGGMTIKEKLLQLEQSKTKSQTRVEGPKK